MSEAAKMEIIRADRQGRTRYSPEYRQQALDEFESSGQTAMAFAEQLGVKYSTFASWVSKANRSGDNRPENAPKARPSFLLAEIAEEVPGRGVRVSLPGGAEARATTREEMVLLADLLKALA